MMISDDIDRDIGAPLSYMDPKLRATRYMQCKLAEMTVGDFVQRLPVLSKIIS